MVPFPGINTWSPAVIVKRHSFPHSFVIEPCDRIRDPNLLQTIVTYAKILHSRRLELITQKNLAIIPML